MTKNVKKTTAKNAVKGSTKKVEKSMAKKPTVKKMSTVKSAKKSTAKKSVKTGKIKVTSVKTGRVSYFNTIHEIAEKFMKRGLSDAKNISSVMYNIKSAMMGTEVRVDLPHNRMTAYGSTFESKYKVEDLM